MTDTSRTRLPYNGSQQEVIGQEIKPLHSNVIFQVVQLDTVFVINVGVVLLSDRHHRMVVKKTASQM
jgi:hypothetical protein